MENCKGYDIIWKRGRPYWGVIMLQFGLAGMLIISKFALNQGMSPHVLVVYRHLVATFAILPFALVFDRKVRPKMTFSIFVKIVLLGLLEPTIDQNLYYTGMKKTTATFTSAMCNVLPAFAFLMAWALRLEKVNVRKLHSQAKILGTVVTVGGAMLMTLVKGSTLKLPWTHQGLHQHGSENSSISSNDMIKGAIMISVGCFCWAAFITLQAITLNTYPAELSLTVLICFFGAIQGSIVAVAMEWDNPSVWAIHFDAKLLAVVYSGVICSGVTYYVQGMIMKSRGPVFVTAFNPLSMVIVTILGSFFLSETMYLGRILGAVVIVIGLYVVLWGKSKDNPTTHSENDIMGGGESALEYPTTHSENDIKGGGESALEMDSMNGKSEVSNQEFVTIDVIRVKPTQDTV